MKRILIYDTTLRDGAQSEGVSFSVSDKINISRKLDELGVHYIEGGWPGSNPKDIEFFRRAKEIGLKHAKLAAFGSTCRKDVRASSDKNLLALIESCTPVVTIFGKSWGLHVEYALRTTMAKNLEMIYESVKFLKSKRREVIYDAEHFFDGWKSDKEYALKTVQAAQDAGADFIALADTNGGMLPFEIEEVVREVMKKLNVPVGIHAHNDSDTAVANSLAAVRAGATMVQGTIGGLGERTGNANLCSVIPDLEFKMNVRTVPKKSIARLTETCHYILEVANIAPQNNMPYVGRSAFAHKGGVHVSAVERHPKTYEHIQPELVGSRRRILASELSGRSNILSKAREFHIDFTKKNEIIGGLLKQLKEMEGEGYQFEGADASLELMMRRADGSLKEYFELIGFSVTTRREKAGPMTSEATMRLVVNGREERTTAPGDGPVNALDNALRLALERFYPQLKEMTLSDFKVRVIDSGRGTASKVRVIIESSDKKKSWSTVGVSENIIEASWQALVDSVAYKLSTTERARPAEKSGEVNEKRKGKKRY